MFCLTLKNSKSLAVRPGAPVHSAARLHCSFIMFCCRQTNSTSFYNIVSGDPYHQSFTELPFSLPQADCGVQHSVLHKCGWTKVCRANCRSGHQLAADDILLEIT